MLVFWVFRNEGKAAMSDNGIKPTENADTRFVTIRAETWRALLEIAGRQIDPESGESIGVFDRSSTLTESTPISRPSAIASDVAFSPGLLDPWCGSNLETCRRQLARHFGCGLAVCLPS
jgi:hypothetical protein